MAQITSNDNTDNEFSDFIAYIDDDGTPREIYAEVLDVKEGFVTFRTKGNIITIPAHRLLKIKKRTQPPNTPPNTKAQP